MTASRRMSRALVIAAIVASVMTSVFVLSIPADAASKPSRPQCSLARPPNRQDPQIRQNPQIGRNPPSGRCHPPDHGGGRLGPGCPPDIGVPGPDDGLLRLQADLRRAAPQLSPPRAAGGRCRKATAVGAQPAWRHAERLAGRGHHGDGRLRRRERLSGGLSRRDEDLQGAHPRPHRQTGAVRLECRQVLRSAGDTAHQRRRIPVEGHCRHRIARLPSTFGGSTSPEYPMAA